MMQQHAVGRKNAGKGVSLILDKADRRRQVAFERAQVFQQHLFKTSLQLVCQSQNN